MYRQEARDLKNPEAGRQWTSKAEQESDLLKRLEQGDPEALEEVVREYHGKLFSLALGICNTPEDAEEVVQNVYMKIVTKIHAFERRSALSTWLFRVTVNESLMKRRRRKKDDLLTPLGDFHAPADLYGMAFCRRDATPLENLEARELRESIGQALKELPNKYRQAFVHKYMDGRSLKETSRAMNTSVPAIKSRLVRCRAFLRAQLARDYSFAA